MNHLTRTILFYEDRESKTHTFEYKQALKRTFTHGHFDIIAANRHDFERALTSTSPAIVILPEILGEESFYSRHISKTCQDALKTYVKNGGMLVTSCASTYWMGEQIVYNPPKNATKIRNGAHAFNAASLKMYGPVPGLWRPSNGKPNTGGCSEIDITVHTANGLVSEKIWYGNGPCILPFHSNALPSNVTPIAYYKGIEDNPVAAACIHLGKGKILMSGPLPHYWAGSVKQNNMLWRVMSHQMHQQLFAQRAPTMVSVPS